MFIVPYILLILGFISVIKGAGFLVDGASSIAKRFGVSALVIGLTIVALGTSTPELIVNLIASIQHNSGIATGNILGSNIANILLILGVSAFIFPLTVSKGTAWKEIPLSLLAIILVFFLVNDAIIDKQNFSTLTRIDGVVLISFFIIFIYYTFGISRITGKNKNNNKDGQLSNSKSITYIVLGCLLLPVGGKLIIDSAVQIATTFGLSEAMIGLTIVAVGTSIPELAASAVAAYRGRADIAIGNVIGSNIFNIFWVLGISAVINPIPFDPALNIDVFATILATLLLFTILFIGKRHVIQKWQGAFLVIMYISYISFVVIRG